MFLIIGITILVIILLLMNVTEPFTPVTSQGKTSWSFGANVKKVNTGTLEVKSLGDNTRRMLVDMLFPIGSVMVRYDDKNPKNLQGFIGTDWEIISTDKYVKTSTTGGTTGGSNNSGATTLALSQIPSHSHGFTHQFGSSGSHTHNISGTTGTAGSHNHSVSRPGYYTTRVGLGTERQLMSRYRISGDSPSDGDIWIGYAGDHSHSFSGSSGSAGSHTHTLTGTIGNVGGGGSHSHSINPPYVTLVFWRRKQ